MLYKGYYYDNDIEMYYLKYRFYNPLFRRFFQIDTIDYLDNSSVVGLNLYSYCKNNPIMYIDENGHVAISLTMIGLITGALIGAVAGGTIAYNVAKENGKTGWELFGWTFLGAVGGGVIGGALGAGIGAFVTHSTGILGLSITKYSIIPIKSTTMLGTMPGYISAATATGSGYYLISEKLWDSMTVAERWYNNSQYISDANKLGSQFAIFAERVPKEGSALWQEIQYLIEHNIPWSMH